MQCEGRCGAGERVHLCGVGKLLLDGGRGLELQKLAEAGSRVGKSPGGKLNPQRIERLNYAVTVRAQCLIPLVEN